ncbi:MAG: hypothetical protein Q9160_007911 [Pyrenula sp. 1 TL-2023]
MAAPQTSVLFVCLGNICRSPMAEGVFRKLSKDSPSISHVDSAGTGAYHTMEPPDYRTMATLKKNGITDYDHGARKIAAEDFNKFDYIFAMDSYNLRDLMRMQQRIDRGKPAGEKTTARVELFGKYGGRTKEEQVEDPYYGGDTGFDDVYEQVVRFSHGFLQSLDRGSPG